MIENDGDDTENKVIAITLGIITGFFWPIVWPIYLLWKVAPKVLVAKSREAELREREEAVEKREREIARLERKVLSS